MIRNERIRGSTPTSMRFFSPDVISVWMSIGAYVLHLTRRRA